MDRLPHVPDVDGDTTAGPDRLSDADRAALGGVAGALADARGSAVSEFYSTEERRAALAAAQRQVLDSDGLSAAELARRHHEADVSFPEFVGFYDAFLDRAAEAVVASTDEPDAVADRLVAFTRSVLRELSTAGAIYAEAGPSEPAGSVSELDDELTDLRRASEEIDDHVDDITDLARTQSRQISTVADEVTTFTATTQEIAATAQQVDQASVEAESLAADGQAAAESAIDRMEAIDTARGRVQEQFDTLNDRLSRIDDVVAALEDIADQTNLLSLNASIEAARAGDAGEGFAVVADEVNALAEEAQEQAAEIGSLVDEISHLTDDTAESFDEAAAEITDGVSEVEQTLSRLDDIAAAVDEASEGMSEVAAATDTQAGSADEVAQKIEETARLANEVTSEVETVSASNQFLAVLIDEARATVETPTAAGQVRPPGQD